MQGKDEMKRLTPEFKNEMTKELSIKEIIAVASTSKKNLEFFKPIADVHKFLFHVTRGNHEVVRKLLAKNANLSYMKG